MLKSERCKKALDRLSGLRRGEPVLTARLTQEEKEYFMGEALKEAEQAQAIQEVPIGCVIVQNGQIIARGHNRRESDQLTQAHAEMQAIQVANKKLGNWRLENCQLFVTLEPCTMCAGAIVLARIDELYFGASDPKSGMAGSIYNLLEHPQLNHQVQVEAGVLEDECSQILKDFFKSLRQKKKQER